MLLAQTDKATSGRANRYNIGTLKSKHYQIIDLALVGESNVDIAKALDMHTQTVGMILRSPLVMSELARRRKESDSVVLGTLDRSAMLGKAKSILEQGAEDAAQKHIELLDTDDPSLQLKAATHILDRVFGRADEVAPVIHITTEQVQLINLALKESHDGPNQEQPANGTCTNAPENEQGHVLQGSEAGPEDE